MKTTVTSAITRLSFVMVLVLTTFMAQSQCVVLTPGIVTGPSNVCGVIGTGTAVTYSIAGIPFASSYQWVIPPTNVTLVSGQGTTSITVNFLPGFAAQNNKQIRVRAVFPCGISGYRVFYINPQVPGTPRPIIQGVQDICGFIGTGNAVAYTIPSVPAAASYTWTAPSGTNVLHPNGTGPNDTTVLLTFASGFTTGDICVQSINPCGSSSLRCFTIRTTTPQSPGVINGTTNVCESIGESGTPLTYSVSPVAGAVSYTWSTPAGTVVTHPNGTGPNDFSITVAFPAGFASGTIAVSVTTACGTSAVRELTVSRLLPSAPGAITATEVAPCPNRVYTYSIANIPLNSTSIQWTVPAGGTIISGQGTTSLIVSYASTAINGLVGASGESNCGSSQIRTLAVNLADCDAPPPPPPTPFARNFSADVNTASESLQLKVSPNPAVNDFNIQVLSDRNEKIQVRILDISGRELKIIIAFPNQVIRFGNALKAGMYILVVQQGNIKKTEKLIRF